MPAALIGTRTDQARVTVKIDGVDVGVFETRSGGDTSSSSTQYKLGGMGPRISLGGTKEVQNVTVKCIFDSARIGLVKWILGRVGKGRMTVTEQPLDGDGAAYGDPLVWSGILIRAMPPERDANSDAAAELELEMDVSGEVG